MSNIEFPKSTGSNARMNAIEIVLRSILASLPREQFDKVQNITKISMKKISEDETLSPSNHLQALEIGELVDFLFAHMPDRAN